MNWCFSAESPQAWCYLADLPPSIRRCLALRAESDGRGGIEVSAKGLSDVADVRGFTIDNYTALGALPSILEGLAAGIASARPYAVRNVAVSRATCLLSAAALAGVAHVSLRGCSRLTDVSALAGAVRVSLSGCKDLTDVSALGGVRVLHLETAAAPQTSVHLPMCVSFL